MNIQKITMQLSEIPKLINCLKIFHIEKKNTTFDFLSTNFHESVL